MSIYIDNFVFFERIFVKNDKIVVDKRFEMRYHIFIQCGGYAVEFERGDSYGVFLFRRDPSQRK